jgi:hypothetical protein
LFLGICNTRDRSRFVFVYVSGEEILGGFLDLLEEHPDRFFKDILNFYSKSGFIFQIEALPQKFTKVLVIFIPWNSEHKGPKQKP